MPTSTRYNEYQRRALLFTRQVAKGEGDGQCGAQASTGPLRCQPAPDCFARMVAATWIAISFTEPPSHLDVFFSLLR